MKYHLTYSVTPHPEGLTKEEIPEGHGGTDAVLIISIILPEDGSISQATMSLNGKTREPLTVEDEWKAWFMLGAALENRKDLKEWKREVCEFTTGLIRAALFGDPVPVPPEEPANEG